MRAQSVWRDWRRDVHNILEVGGEAHPAGYFVNSFIIALILLNAIAFAAETVPSIAASHGTGLDNFNAISVAIFTIEYILRVWSAVDIPILSRMPHWRARLRFMLRPIMIVDLLAVLPFYLQWFIPIDLRILRVLRVFRLLKITRYSPALQTLGRVLEDEYRTLIGALIVMLIVLLFASTAMYFLERDAQPDKFGSIPDAAWWSLATLTTVGYGDVVPVTPLGKVFGGVVMVLGLCMFALPVAIIATGFSQESSRHQFVVTWSKVARAAAVQHHGRDRDCGDHQAALYAHLSPRRADRARGRPRRRHVSDRKRRGHRCLAQGRTNHPERRRFFWRDGVARTAQSPA